MLARVFRHCAEGHEKAGHRQVPETPGQEIRQTPSLPIPAKRGWGAPISASSASSCTHGVPATLSYATADKEGNRSPGRQRACRRGTKVFAAADSKKRPSHHGRSRIASGAEDLDLRGPRGWP